MVSLLHLLLSTLSVGLSWAAPEAETDALPPPPPASVPSDAPGDPEATGETVAPTGAADVSEDPAPSDPENADQLLDRLAKIEDTLRTYRAENVRYTTISEFVGDMQQRIGSLTYDTGRNEQGERTGRRKFRVEFEGMQVGQRIDRDRGESYVFDGRWLLELRPKDKQAVRRELVAPGEDFDPLAIGNAPFFVPIGQPKQEILSRFEASLVEPSDGLGGEGPLAVLEHLRPFAKNTYQLLLKPKPAADLEDVELIRIWYDRQTLLPSMAMISEITLDHKIVELRQATVNPELEPQTFSTRPQLDGWDVIEN